MKRPRILPPVYLLIGVGLMLALHFVIPLRHLVAWPWRWIGVGVIVIGVAMGGWAVTAFIRHKTTIKPGELSSYLMTSGPFGFTRNPIYLGMVLILVGVVVLIGSVSPWIAIPMFVWAINRNIIPVEEEMLDEAFGDEYRAYQKRVPGAVYAGYVTAERVAGDQNNPAARRGFDRGQQVVAVDVDRRAGHFRCGNLLAQALRSCFIGACAAHHRLTLALAEAVTIADDLQSRHIAVAAAEEPGEIGDVFVMTASSSCSGRLHATLILPHT